MEEAIGAGLEQDAATVDEHQTTETGHGRQETRTYAIFPAPETVDPDGLWQDLSAVGMAITESTDSQGHGRLEARYYILSVLLSAQEFAAAVRGHWGIENNLHWQLDVSFREDECRVRTDHAPANLSVIRRFALGLLKRETSCRRGIETKRLKCAASDEYREKVLFSTRDKMRLPWPRAPGRSGRGFPPRRGRGGPPRGRGGAWSRGAGTPPRGNATGYDESSVKATPTAKP